MIITGRDRTALQKAGRELRRIAGTGRPALRGDAIIPLPCNIRDPGAVQSLFATIKKRFGYLDILINNAGIAHPSFEADKLPVSTFREVIETNLTGMFLVTHYAVPLMRRGGVIVNNLSIAAKRVFLGSAAYNASKHGALGFTNTLREELRKRGIRVIALLPGATDTDIWNTLWPDAPRKKMMSPETVATAVVNALMVPANSTVEELVIMPASGTL